MPHASNAFLDLSDLSLPEFWHELKFVKNETGKPRFKTLAKLICSLLALPHFGACVERVFSEVNIVKTGRTNKMHSSIVANRLLAKQAISRSNTTCYTWKPSKSLLSDFKARAPHLRYCRVSIEILNFFFFLFYLPYLSSIHEKANCIAILWTVSPHSLGSCLFRGLWLTCLPHEGGASR